MSNVLRTPSILNRCCMVATWDFGKLAINRAIPDLLRGGSALDAVEKGINAVELNNDDQYFVGVGGYPNSNGIMELDAAIMDDQCRYGAVMALQEISTPISVARSVLEKSPHNILVGEGAKLWAFENGFRSESILTESVREEWKEWKKSKEIVDQDASHDTVGFICLDKNGKLAAGTSTSGWKFKWPGRVGDSPVIGSGLYCDGSVGAAVATGDGEEIMRVCLSFMVVEYMRHGTPVHEACTLAVERMRRLIPPSGKDTMHSTLVVGVVAMDINGRIGAASTLSTTNPHRGTPYFPVAYWREDETVEPQLLAASTDGARFP